MQYARMPLLLLFFRLLLKYKKILHGYHQTKASHTPPRWHGENYLRLAQKGKQGEDDDVCTKAIGHTNIHATTTLSLCARSELRLPLFFRPKRVYIESMSTYCSHVVVVPLFHSFRFF